MPRHLKAAPYQDRLTEDQRKSWITSSGYFRLKIIRASYQKGVEIPDWLVDVIEAHKRGYLDRSESQDTRESNSEQGEEEGPSFTSFLSPVIEERTPRRTVPIVQMAELTDEERQVYARLREATLRKEQVIIGVTPQNEIDEIEGVISECRAQIAVFQAAEAERTAQLEAEELRQSQLNIDKDIETGGGVLNTQNVEARTFTTTTANTSESTGTKRKFKWLVSDYRKGVDEYNQRNPDGTLKEPEKTPDYEDAQGKKYVDGSDLPEDWDETKFYNAFQTLNDVNGKPAYDPEENALGLLSKTLYMQVPIFWKTDICHPDNVCGGLLKYTVPTLALAAVYSLAKEQAKKVSEDKDEQIKWAVLRMEAFKAGWFDNQKHCERVDPGHDFVRTMLADWEKIALYLEDAYRLCAFIPYLNEFCFRTTCSSFNPNNTAEYTLRAEKFAESTQFGVKLNYLPAAILYGSAFRWVGVRRPMQVLTSRNAHIPSVFTIRRNAAPAGQAMITSSSAVIKSLQAAGWWDAFKARGGYDEVPIIALSDKIESNPFKYHQLSGSYGVEALTQADKVEINIARDLVVKVSPVLQAYMQVILRRSALGKVKVLLRHAQGNPQLLLRLTKMFNGIVKKKVLTLADVYAAYAFDAPAQHEPAN